jgi:hypothetical protein
MDLFVRDGARGERGAEDRGGLGGAAVISECPSFSPFRIARRLFLTYLVKKLRALVDSSCFC